MHFAVADGGGADDERAVGDGCGESFVDFGGLENFCRADRRARALESYVVGMHEAEAGKSEVADGAGGGADVQRVARVDENDSEIADLFWREHEGIFYGRIAEMADDERRFPARRIMEKWQMRCKKAGMASVCR